MAVISLKLIPLLLLAALAASAAGVGCLSAGKQRLVERLLDLI